MIKKSSLLLVCLLLSAGIYAAERVSGQIVYADKTVDVTFLIPVGLFGGGPNTEALQKRVRYLDPKGKKRWLKPDQAKEFRFSFGGANFRMVSHANTVTMLAMTSRVFLLQLFDGQVKMFEHRQTTTSGGGPNMPMNTTQTISYFLQKGNGALVEPRVLGFKKEMAEYFADCPTLVGLIQEREFKRRDLDEIVMFYNSKCPSK
jgi:hypothetical protein